MEEACRKKGGGLEDEGGLGERAIDLRRGLKAKTLGGRGKGGRDKDGDHRGKREQGLMQQQPIGSPVDVDGADV